MRPTERSFYLGVIAVLSALLFLSRSCNHGQAECQRTHCDDLKPIEVTAIDTVERVVKESSEWHKPQASKPDVKKAKDAQFEPVMSSNDTYHEPEAEKARNEPGMTPKPCFVKFYSDTTNLEAGKVIVQAVGNIDSLRVIADLKERTIEKTVTKTLIVPEKPRGHLFAGILAQGQRFDPLTGFGGSLTWKSKRDKMWSISVLFGKDGQKIYQAGGSFKLF